MNQPPRELFTAERPVRSDFSRERSYARRRVVTLIILALVVGGVIYAVMGHRPTDPADIPTIKAEGSYRQKPADPGGIDIPHQDVHVYDQLEGKNAVPVPVEHLLPPPENPIPNAQAVPAALTPVGPPVSENIAPPAPPSQQADVNLIDPIPKPLPTTVAPTVAAAPEPQNTALSDTTKPEVKNKLSVPTMPVAPTTDSIAKPKSPASSIMSIDQILTTLKSSADSKKQKPLTNEERAKIAASNGHMDLLGFEAAAKANNTSQQAPAVPPQAAVASQAPVIPPPTTSPVVFHAASTLGNTAVQLASVPDEGKAKETMVELQQKYASDLSGITLHLTRADLGAKGVYYRIQSQGISQDAATHLCAALKQKNAGCILVRR